MSEHGISNLSREDRVFEPPAELAAAGKFAPACPKPVQDIHTAIWTELQK